MKPESTLVHGVSLSDDDFGVLLESLEAWENKDFGDNLIGSLMTSMLARTPEQKQELLAEQKEEQRKSDATKRVRKERSVLLRAKLIQIRDRMLVQSVSS